jgi:hypothetical protein
LEQPWNFKCQPFAMPTAVVHSDGDCNASFNEMLFMCGTESEYDITSKEM